MNYQTLFRRASVIAGAVTCVAGLTAYSYNSSGGIDWKYFGTPTSGTTTYDTSSGKPRMSEYSDKLPGNLPPLASDIMTRIHYLLPESKNINTNSQGLIPDSDSKTNIILSQSADVWMTFLSEGAGFQNSFGYFTYDPNNPPTTPSAVNEKIVWLNASTPSPLSEADPVNKTAANSVYLGKFPAGTAIGFVVVANGWATNGRVLNGQRIAGTKDYQSPSWVFYSLRNLNPEKPGTNYNNAHTIMLNDLTVSGSGFNRFVLAFEDYNREQGSDNDFNDVVFAITTTPDTAVANASSIATLASASDPDTDGDGVKDSLDEFPNDSTRAFSRYYPDQNVWGTVAFEDAWPQKGDFDMNDMLIRYRSREILNAARNVAGLEMSLRLDARGATNHSGFALDLPGIKASAVTSATLSLDGGAALPVTVESGQTEAVFVIFSDGFTYTDTAGGSGECFYFNSVNECPHYTPHQFLLTVNFSQLNGSGKTIGAPIAASAWPGSPYNPFIFGTGKRGAEVHLPGMQPTKLADTSLFGTGNDTTKAGTSHTYVTDANLPWALTAPYEWVYPKEHVDVAKAYPDILNWALSAGTGYTTWYTNLVNSSNAYTNH